MGLYKRKGSRFYWMSFKMNGKRTYESTRTSNKQLAEKRYAKRLAEIEDDSWFPDESRKKTVGDLIAKYQAEYTSKSAYEPRNRSIFKHLRTYFGEATLLREVEKLVGNYEGYRASMGVMPGTIVKELGLLRRMFNIARKKWRWVRDNPVSYIEMPKVNNERV